VKESGVNKHIMAEFKDLLLEEKGGKISTKKFYGGIAVILVYISYILDGFTFFTVNEHLFDSMLVFAGTMLGLSIARYFSKQKPSE
jgi:hypothetical protein